MFVTGWNIACLIGPDPAARQETLDEVTTIDFFRQSSIQAYCGHSRLSAEILSRLLSFPFVLHGMFKSISRTFVLLIGSRSIIGSEITNGAPMVPRRAIKIYNSLILKVYMAARTRLSAKLFCLHFRFLDVANPD
jgi:hypothetical protein